MPAADIAATDARVAGLFRQDERLQILIYRIGIRDEQAADVRGKGRNDVEFHHVSLTDVLATSQRSPTLAVATPDTVSLPHLLQAGGGVSHLARSIDDCRISRG